jgi:hypothetical protein
VNTVPTVIGSMQLLDIDGDGPLDVGAHMIGPDSKQAAFFSVKNGVLQDLVLPAFAGGGLSQWQAIDLHGTGGRDFFQAYADPQGGLATEQHPVFLQAGNPLPPGPPSTLRAQSTTAGAVRLSWAYSWGAVAYQIWRSVGGAPPHWTATTHPTRYDDTTVPPGIAATYTVRAVNAEGTSIDSPAVMFTHP